MSTNTIYEETFAKSDKTDAILVVDGQKLHVNKAVNFAILLSLVHPNPLKPTVLNAENLLELADRFLLPAAKRHLELFLLSSDKNRFEKLRIADKYGLNDLFDQGLKMYTDQKDFYFMKVTPTFENFSDANKVKILDRLFVVLKL
ncbi:hypothetical protein CAEBREN_18168 [Caenorhabditis brenneri]|uniref:BTB domain-containing protein n=1 Tax=Caenorhabditis brenneri TaxID=135651 RepID=G0MVV5_CAEBE|nr:hypothetical protein CAEBREN_18168 [Caenorhabditis brenneri]